MESPAQHVTPLLDSIIHNHMQTTSIIKFVGVFTYSENKIIRDIPLTVFLFTQNIFTRSATNSLADFFIFAGRLKIRYLPSAIYSPTTLLFQQCVLFSCPSVVAGSYTT
uniref:Uncharacterized protein n=1 Tax=Picea glauca TaxID=3330 RepID=A0A101LZL4_PICGL|nr:hypothetical protein ABT39_MTgene5304 [Picea glauca]